MKYITFNILFLLLLIAILSQNYMIKEYFYQITPENAGFYISTKPVVIDIIKSKKEPEKIQKYEQVFPTKYSEPKVIIPITQKTDKEKEQEQEKEKEKKIAQEKEQEPEITINDIEKCKQKLSNIRLEFDKYTSSQISEQKKVNEQDNLNDLELNNKNAAEREKNNIESNKIVNEYTKINKTYQDKQDSLMNCQLRIDKFNLNYELPRKCCSAEEEKSRNLKENIRVKCIRIQEDLNNEKKILNDNINIIKGEINRTQADISDIQNKIKIKNC